MTSRSARPPAVTSTDVSRSGVGPCTSRPSTATTRNSPPVGHTRIGPASVLTIRTRTGVPGAAVTGTSPARPLMVRRPS